MTQFPQLFSAIELGKTRVKNRIVSTGHHSYLADKEPGEDLIAYHEARARGGVGLIITEIVAVHETAGFSRRLLTFEDAEAGAAYRRLTEACHRHDCRIFAQLFHPGREILSSWSGFAPIAYAPSAVANERFHIMPRPMSRELIAEIVAGFGETAASLASAGFDGVEIVGSHGYLPAQFLSPAVNRRDDAYGGDFDGRLRFVRECVAAIRRQAPQLTLGLRLSAKDYEPDGLDQDAVADICVALESELDYFSLVAGSSATLGASVHITPAMGFDNGYVAPLSERVKTRLKKPVIITGRINQPQLAEQIIVAGQADLCGMTRALICDPDMPDKSRRGQLDDIRACIGCNQACIGRAHKGLSISCIQFPESGRELRAQQVQPAAAARQLLVVGGGPAGMKAAAVAAARGHQVTLHESENRLGGQALLAQSLPGREEFGGIVSNLQRELEVAGVEVKLASEVTLERVRQLAPDHVIVATGARPLQPALDLDWDYCVNYEDILLQRKFAGRSVVIADWKADWIGIGLAERLAREGCRVRLAVNAALAGESLQIYTRNHYLARLYRLGVEVLTHMRLFGNDQRSVYLQNTLSDEAVVLEDVDTLVLALGQSPKNQLEQALRAAGIDATVIGDCLIPRTAEEAVYEAWTVAAQI